MRFRSSSLVACVALSTVSGCHAPGDAARSVTAVTAVQTSLDSCNALVWPATGQDTDGQAGASGKAAGLTSTVHTFRLFSLFVPDSAEITGTDSGLGGPSLTWPGCSGCRFGVSIQGDSGVGLEARIARIIAAQRTIDSINRDPHTVVHEFDEIDGPPQPFVTRTGRGYLIDNDCGDCAAMSLLFGRPGYIATIGLGGDDDVPDLGRHLCEMTVIGKTFEWRP